MSNSHKSKLMLPVIALSLMTVISAVASLNVALPAIARDLGASQTQLTWIVDAYTVIFAGLLLLSGSLGDRFGRKWFLSIGLILYAIASSLGLFAASTEQLIGIRILMGVGAAFIMPSTLSIITSSFEKEERPKAISVWVGVAGGGAVIGLFGTAFLMRYFSWHSFFALNLSLAIVSLCGTLMVIPESREIARPPLDILGGLLSVVAVGALVLGIIEGPDQGWNSRITIGGIAIGVAALIGFVMRELRVEHPLLDPRLFKNRGFSSGSLSITVQFFGQFGFIFVGLQYLQFVAGFSPWGAAVHLLPMPFIVLPASRLSGYLSGKLPQKYLGSAGLAIFGLGLFIFSRMSLTFNYTHFLIGLFCFGFGMAMAAVPATTAITNSLPIEKQGVASAVNDTAREFGSALGIAVLGAALTNTYTNAMVTATVGLPPETAAKIQNSLAFVQQTPAPQLRDKFHQLAATGLNAFHDGVSLAMTIAAVVALTGSILVLIIAPKERSTSI